MSYPLVRPQVSAPMPIEGSENWTPAQFKLITEVIAKGATPDELKLFLYRCNKMGLDPLKAGQIFFIKYGNNPGTIVVGIEGMRSRAHRTNKLKGIKRGVVRDDKGLCVGAWAKAKHADWDEWAEAEVSLAEYSTGKAGWSKMPETMIQKCAEAAVLRMAFPDELGDAYAPEEMDKRSEDPRPIVSDQPGEQDGIYHGYTPNYGRFAKKPLENCDPEELRAEIAKYEADAAVKKRPLLAWQAEFVKHAEPLIAQYEQAIAQSMREPGSEG